MKLAYLTLSPLLLLAACVDADAPVRPIGDPPGGPMGNPPVDPPTGAPRFAAAADAVRQRAIASVSGRDVAVARAVVDSIPSYPAAACPRVRLEQGRRVIEGGCDLVGGGRIDGRITATGGTRELVFDRFVLERGGARIAFDGLIREADGTALTVDLATELDGVLTEVNATYAADRAWGELTLEGFGAAHFDGPTDHGALDGTDTQPVDGVLTLSAADALRVQYRVLDQGCPAYLIDGRLAGRSCRPPAPALPAVRDDLIVTTECGADGRMVVTAETGAPVNQMVLSLRTGTIIRGGVPSPIYETHTLDPVSLTIQRRSRWRVSGLACERFVTTGHKMTGEKNGVVVVSAGL
jgi:hypothetical protein